VQWRFIASCWRGKGTSPECCGTAPVVISWAGDFSALEWALEGRSIAENGNAVPPAISTVLSPICEAVPLLVIVGRFGAEYREPRPSGRHAGLSQSFYGTGIHFPPSH
jgi:hypothetical protein